MVAKPTNTEQVQAISARLWSAGYLPGEHAGVSFRAGGDPILYINNPPGVPSAVRRDTLDGLRSLNELNYQQVGDPETHTRIQQYDTYLQDEWKWKRNLTFNLGVRWEWNRPATESNGTILVPSAPVTGGTR